MPQYWLNTDELQNIKGPQGQKSIAAQIFVWGQGVPRINILFDDGLMEIGVPRGRAINKETKVRVELLRQKARHLGLNPRGPVRKYETGRRCPVCEFPLRLCLCSLLENAEKHFGTRLEY